tara:strand:- start:170 stop:1150 length:981 start_codon:yes stop_codon:yes gene_type:complete
MNFINQDFIYLVAFITSFLVTFLVIPWLIPRLESRKIVGIDMNKITKPKIPEIGGIAVVLGVFLGFYSQFAIYAIYEIGVEPTSFLLASIMTLMGIAFIGIIDDLLGMRQLIKAVLPFLFALPLGVFANSSMVFPFIGHIEFGYLILFLVPFGITCAANSMNMLEGFNGLGAGLGIIITSTLILLSLMNGKDEGLFLLVPLLGSLLAFFYFNKYPAKIFPGDTLTLFMGGIIGCAAIINNLKLEGVILMFPMIVEFFLKLRGNFKGECFAKMNEGGILFHEGRIESLTHLVMSNFTVDEIKLVRLFWFFELILCLFVIILTVMDII